MVGRTGERRGPAARLWRHAIGRWSWSRLLVVLVIVAAPAVLSYPAAAEYFDALRRENAVSGYVETAEGLGGARRNEELEAARTYNENLPNGPLRDPYTIDANGDPVPIGLGRPVYESTLAVGERGVMGRLIIPAIHVDLPIYHGTDDATLDAGVGHLYGSGLPVGGPGVHSVLTAHSGVVGSRLFTDLLKVSIGQTFQLSVLGERLSYRVETIETVEPDQLDSLRQVPDRDLVTLVTCTPIGVNTHRLLVTGSRIPTPESADDAESPELAGVAGPGFPWWPFPTLGAGLLGLAVTRPRAHRPDARAAQQPFIEVTFRRRRTAEFRIWMSRCRRALGAAPLLPAGHERVGGVFTWSLRDEHAHSLAASARAFLTWQEAEAHALHCVRLAETMEYRTALVNRRRGVWFAGEDAADPDLFQSAPGPAGDSGTSALAALSRLRRASAPLPPPRRSLRGGRGRG
ncbi:class C sortase [uncultured Leifsonia sp.]|uniref:class C sortase n=1 Tax=uncultured Leifsonia sp. TaxID=340359 RepID=UPI0028D7EA15|nr:class C sortase [uncultured Leifsonia sp.]